MNDLNNTYIALISASAALSGVILAQAISLLTTFLEHKHKKNVLLQQKYEEIAVLFSNSLLWFQTVQECKSVEELSSLSHSTDARKMYSLCLVYFPKLREPGQKYLNAMMLFYQFTVTNYDPNVPATAGAQITFNKEYTDVVASTVSMRQNMESAIEKYSSTYVKT